MDKKPPRPRTLPVQSKTEILQLPRPSRKHRGASWSARREHHVMDLHRLASDIKSIIQGVSIERHTTHAHDDISGRAYIGISRSETLQKAPKLQRRRIISSSASTSSFYGEKASSDLESKDVSHAARRQPQNALDRYSSRHDARSKAANRTSCPWDMEYFETEESTMQIFARELQHMRELRDKEVRDLVALNSKLQDDLFDADRDVCTLEERNAILEKRLEDMGRVYERIRDNLKHCLRKVRDLETIEKLTSPKNSLDEESLTRTLKIDLGAEVSSLSSGINTLSSDVSSVHGYDGDWESSNGVDFSNGESPPNGPSDAAGVQSSDRTLLGRLQADVDSLSLVNTDQSQEIERLRAELSTCRKHVMSSQFQLEAVEIECSRLLAMEDQLISVVTLLERAKKKHVHRQILGDLIYSALNVSREAGTSGIPVDIFLREIQEQLSLHPLLAVTKDDEPRQYQDEFSASAAAETSARSSGSDVRRKHKGTTIEDLKFIDDDDFEHAQLSDTDSFHSLGKHLQDGDAKSE